MTNWVRVRPYGLIAGEPPSNHGISERVEEDPLTTIECGNGETRNQPDGKHPADQPTSADARSDRNTDLTRSNRISGLAEISGHSATTATVVP